MLKNFDKAVLDGWNPVYYGRYVDDVIIVDKIERSSELFKKSQRDLLRANDIIDYYMEKCKGWSGESSKKCQNENEYALFISEECCGLCEEKKKADYDSKKDKEKIFNLNKLYNPVVNDNSKITVNDNKIKAFYFKTGESDALITYFREK